jgi:hypothetical protein
MHDRTLTDAMQTPSVCLLLNLIEGILKDNSETRMRQLLVRIMNSIHPHPVCASK